MMKRKRLLALVLALALSMSLLLTACQSGGSGGGDSQGGSASAGTGTGADASGDGDAAAYPNGPIDIVVGAGAGGGSDTFARALGQELSDIFGVAVNVLNLPGGNEAIALEEMVSRPADGQTLMVTTSTTITEIAQGNREDPESTDGLSLFHEDTYGLHVKTGGNYATIDDLIDAAKADPGKISIGGIAPLSLDELVVRKLENAADVQFNYIPYDEAGKMQADVLGGHIDAMIDEFAPTVELIEAEEVIPVIAFANETLELYPDVLTSGDKGWDITDGLLRGVLIKAGTPDDIKATLEAAMKEAYETERYQQFSADRMLNLKEVFTGAEGYDAIIEQKAEEYKAIYEEIMQ